MEKKYKSIKEVSDLLGINPHVIRYWDSRFKGISTRLNSKKQRFFNNENITKLRDLKKTLYENGKHNYSLDLANKIINKRNKNHIIDDIQIAKKIDFNQILELKNISENLKKMLSNL